MNKLEQKIEKLKSKLAQAEEELQQQKPELKVDKFGRILGGLKVGDEYFFVGEREQIHSDNYHCDAFDFARISSGKAFNTSENAKTQLIREQLTQKAREFMYEDELENGPFKCVSLCINQGEITICRNPDTYSFLGFNTKKGLDKFREQFTDTDIKMILGYE